LDIVYGEVTKVPAVIIFKKSKPRKSPKGRHDLDIYLDYDLLRLAKQSGALFLQNESEWKEEYLMAHYHILHLRKHIPKQTSPLLLLNNFRVHYTDQMLKTFEKKQSKVPAALTKLHSYHPAFGCRVNAVFKR